MIEIGRVCKKIAGRDGNNFCVIVDIVDDRHVLIDGNVRRKKCNVLHLAETDKKIDIKKGASTDVVQKELEKLDIKIIKKGSPREKKGDKPVKMHVKKEKPVKKKAKKQDKKEAAKEPEKAPSKEKAKEVVKAQDKKVEKAALADKPAEDSSLKQEDKK